MKRATLCVALIVALALLAACAQLQAAGRCLNAISQPGVLAVPVYAPTA